MTTQNICYTGVGSVKSGNHTRKKYLEIMNKNYKKECPVYIKSLRCKLCKKYKKMINNIVNKQTNAELKNKTYNVSNKTAKKMDKQRIKCEKCKNNKTKKCNLKQYLLFSGAEICEAEK